MNNIWFYVLRSDVIWKFLEKYKKTFQKWKNLNFTNMIEISGPRFKDKNSNSQDPKIKMMILISISK